MQIKQLQVVSDTVQDRLVLRVLTSKNEEFRIFVTRRFLRELWPHLCTMLAGHLCSTPLIPGHKKPVAESHNFEQAFQENNPSYPLGSMPLLASEASLEPAGDGIAHLFFREGRERCFNLKLNAELLQALCAMLRSASENANWDLALNYGKSTPNESQLLPPGTKRPLLH